MQSRICVHRHGSLWPCLLLAICWGGPLGALAQSGAPGADAAPPKATQPPASQTAPAWGSTDPSKWPAMLMYNDGVLTGNMGIGGSGFLFRLPNHAVVAGTVLHVFGENIKIDQLQPMIKSWSMALPNSRRKITIKNLAMKIDPASPVDCVIGNVSQSSSYPAEVLTPRTTGAAVGETVYVPGIARGSDGKLKFYKATVFAANSGDSTFSYIFEPEVDTMGFSGAPILDAHGLLVGIHQAHGTTPDGQKCWIGLNIDVAVKVANAPAPTQIAAKPAASDAKPAAVADDAVKADSALDMAQNYITLGKYDIARTKLQDLIASYPNTAAAKKAKALLADIAGK